MKTLTIRGIDEKLEIAIRKESQKEQKSMNQTVLKLLRKSVGLSDNELFPQFDDLDALAGSWSQKDETEFKRNTRQFEHIDEELWS